MAKRSLKASDRGIAIAKRSFDRTGWTQDYLAAEVGLSTRQSIWKFFSGRSIDRSIFTEICFALNLDWQEVADLPTVEGEIAEKPTSTSANVLPQQDIAVLKKQLEGLITRQCAFILSSLENTQPWQLEKFYTPTYVLLSLRHQQWLDITDLQPVSGRPQLNSTNSEIIAAVELVKHQSKLIILGKPGSGKTTFLQHLALSCQGDREFADLIPVFIRLHEIESQAQIEGTYRPLQWIAQQWRSLAIGVDFIEQLLQQGKILLLIDGMDEASQDFQNKIFPEIQQFAEIYFQTTIVITNRIASQNFYWRNFYTVEISDFRPDQIQIFVEQWFREINHHTKIGEHKAQKFIQALEEKENESIRDLAVTPILLSLLCSIFQYRSSFPTQREKIYQVGLDILLVRWDRTKGIQRDDFYQNLSLFEKINLLSQIAAITFQARQYFFDKSVVLQIISQFLQKSCTSNLSPEERRLTCESVLKSIENQHGLLVERAKDIYSFSHLTFHEYLTARHLVNQYLAQSPTMKLSEIAAFLSNADWREVLRLLATMLPEPTRLLTHLREQIDLMLVGCPDLENLVRFIARHVEKLEIPYHPAALRAFYLSLFYNRQLDLAIALDMFLGSSLPSELAIDLTLIRLLATAEEIIQDFSLKAMLNLFLALDMPSSFSIAPDFALEIHQQKELLPNPRMGKEKLKIWWQDQGQSWVDRLRKLIFFYRYSGYAMPSNASLPEIIEAYLQANQFILDCASHAPGIEPQWLNSLKENLLLPPRE